jgi:hypothetical protein
VQVAEPIVGALAAIVGPMRRTFDPFGLLLIFVTGWLGQQQLDAINDLREENRLTAHVKTGKMGSPDAYC